MNHGISVIVPNYNGAELLPQILPAAIIALKNTNISFELIVADDASADNSKEVVYRISPEIIFLTNQKNSGFAKTANRGIAASKYDWVLLLNSDVKLQPNYFLALLKYMDRPNVFGVMGRIMNWDNSKIEDGAKYPHFEGCKIKTSKNYIFIDEAEMVNGLFSFYLSGANAFISKKIFNSIGGFNEIFSPFYSEDTELSFKAWRLGYTCYYEHFSVCNHKISATIGPQINKKNVEIIYNRNKFYLHAIHLSNYKKAIWLMQLSAESVFRLVTLNISYYKSLTQFIKNKKQIKLSRNKIAQLSSSHTLLSLHQVADKIIDAIKDKKIKKW